MDLEESNPLDNEESGAKDTEVSDEIFHDQQRKNQATTKALKKSESRSRQKDNRLAKVIGKFLQNNSNTAIMLLIARCLDHNIPASLILGLLALVEEEAQAEFENVLNEYLKLNAGANQSENKTQIEKFHTEDFPPGVSETIKAWSNGLLELGFAQPSRLLATMASPDGKLFPSLKRLTSFLLRNFLENNLPESSFEFKNIDAFAEMILQGILRGVRERMKIKKL
jgi:hypothetical protein